MGLQITPRETRHAYGGEKSTLGVAGQGAGAEDELPAGCCGVGGGDRDLHPELEAGMRLARADALHLGGAQGVELVAAAVLAPPRAAAAAAARRARAAR